jgi:hypothetical protein
MDLRLDQQARDYQHFLMLIELPGEDECPPDDI